jgi:hypothetical protein
MGTTVNRAIPYAEPADQLAAYPATDKAAAERLDALLFDTGWVAVTVNAGFAAQSGFAPQVRRIGSVVYARGGISPTGISVSVSIAGVMTLPAGYWPTMTVHVRAGTSSGATAATFIINQANGTIDIRTNATLATYYLLPSPSWVL